MEVYTYTPVWITGMILALISALLSYTKQKRCAKYFSIISIVCILILFYEGHGLDVYYDNRNYLTCDSFSHIGVPGLFNEWLWKFLALCGNKLGLDFFSFRIVVVIVFFTLFYRTYKDYFSHIGIPLFIYLTYFLFMDAMQLQNFMGMSIFLISLKLALDKNNYKNVLKFILCIIVAAGMHTVYWFAVIYLILFIKDIKTFAKLTLGFVSILMLVTLFNHNYVPFVNMLMQMVSSFDIRMNGYSFNASRRGWLAPAAIMIVYLICMFIIVFDLNKRAKRQQGCVDPGMTNRIKLARLILFVDIISLLIIPMNMMISHFYRMIRNISMIQYFCYYSNLRYLSLVHKIMIHVAVIATVVVWCIFEYEYNGEFDSIVVPVLRGMYNYE